MLDQDELQALVEKQAALIERLSDRLGEKDKPASDALAPIDINDVRVPYRFQKFPMLVYKREPKRDTHLDHPGQVHKTVASEKELDLAKKAGWSEQPLNLERTDDGIVDRSPKPRQAFAQPGQGQGQGQAPRQPQTPNGAKA